MGVYYLGEVIAFVSGKGGTGKTSLCAALGTELSKSGRRVLCIDGDVGLRNLDIFLGLSQVEALSFPDICRGDYPLSAAYVHPQYPCLSFLTAPANSTADPIPRWEFERMLEQARKDFEFILLDGPSGIGEGMAMLAQAADRCIVTTLPDAASIRCAERASQTLENLGCQNTRLVVNQVQNDTLKALGMNIDDMMDTVGLPLLGLVPRDLNISIAAAKGKPFLQYSRLGAAPAYKRIAKRLQGQPVPVVNR